MQYMVPFDESHLMERFLKKLQEKEDQLEIRGWHIDRGDEELDVPLVKLIKRTFLGEFTSSKKLIVSILLPILLLFNHG